jgi:hypothetical protein
MLEGTKELNRCTSNMRRICSTSTLRAWGFH